MQRGWIVMRIQTYEEYLRTLKHDEEAERLSEKEYWDKLEESRE